MDTFYKSLLRSLAGWGKRLARRNEPGQLSDDMQAYLAKQFKLLPEEMADLRYVRRRDFVRIFDTAKAREQGVVVKKSSDLDNHSEFVLFHGRLRNRGVAYLKK